MSEASDPRRRFGDRGEDLAAAFFMERGFTVVKRNWNCRAGEIDLILERSGKFHFVEIKTRRSLAFGYPEEAITRKKMHHLRLAIELYLRAMTIPAKDYQIDALAILINKNGHPEYYYLENIF